MREIDAALYGTPASTEEPPVPDDSTLQDQAELTTQFKEDYGTHRIDGDNNPKIENDSSQTSTPKLAETLGDKPAALQVAPPAIDMQRSEKDILNDVKDRLKDDEVSEKSPVTGDLNADLKALQPIQTAVVVDKPVAQITPATRPAHQKRSKVQARQAMQDALMAIDNVTVIDAFIDALSARRDMLTAEGL